MDILQQLLKKPIPQEVWHYTTMHGFEGIVTSGRLWATDVRFLNDLTEFVHAREIAQTLVAEMPAQDLDDVWVKERTQQLVDAYFEVGPLSPSKLEMYIVSFTVLEDGLSQWRGYGSDGVSLCFDLQHIRPPVDLGSLVSFAPCVYEDHEKRELVATALNGFVSKALRLYRASGNLGWAAERLRAWNRLTPKEKADHKSLDEWNSNYFKEELHREFVSTAANLMRAASLCKNRSFWQEREWRLMLPVLKGKSLQTTTRSFRTQNGEQVPYITTTLFRESSGMPLTRVIVGPGGNVEARQRQVKGVLETAKCRVPVEPSKVPLRFF
jgi:hypothetical protein